MKAILFLVVVFIFQCVQADESAKSIGPYKVRSETFDSTIAKGYAKISGNVINSETTKPVFGATICDELKTIGVISDLDGKFELVLLVNISPIYCYMIGYTEVVWPVLLKNQFHIEVDFYFNSSSAMYLKPVIYAYKAPTDMYINIKPKGHLTFSYPLMKSNWHIRTNNDGTLTDIETTKKYPYLFWEGDGSNLDFIANNKQIEGYLIDTDTCLVFLESTLERIGLNRKESADFITFWAPKIMLKKYALIQFLSTDLYSDYIAELNVSPTPESLLRLYLLYLPLDSVSECNQEIVAPALNKFDRKGFTVIEWGGTILQYSRIVKS